MKDPESTHFLARRRRSPAAITLAQPQGDCRPLLRVPSNEPLHQSRRDCGPKPSVAKNELLHQPQRDCESQPNVANNEQPRQSRRDCGPNPRVARNELPWVIGITHSNPERVSSTVHSLSVLLFIALSLFRLAAPLYAQQPVTEEGRTRFCAVDIFIDSKSAPLAAWQIEFTATNGVARIVGIEGGDAEVFHNPPFYDPKAMQHDRVIIAAFSTEPVAKLPVGRTRVATIHLQIIGSPEASFELKLQAAADPTGNRIPVESNFIERKKNENAP